jgi:hypothetical protein
MKVTKVLKAIREELTEPLPEPRVVPTTKKRKRKMAKKAKKGVEDEDQDEDLEEEEDTEDEDDEDEKPSKKAKKGKDKGKSKKKAKSDDDEGYVTVEDLAEEAEINAQSARVKLREAELEKPEGGRWRWKDGSKGLKEARKAIGL